MTHLISTGAAPTVTDPGRHRFVRLGAAAACVAALIAAGGYGATQTFGPDAYEAAPPIAAPPSDLALSQLHESLAAQYGAAAPAVTAPPSDQAVSQLHERLAAQYGAARSAAVDPSEARCDSPSSAASRCAVSTTRWPWATASLARCSPCSCCNRTRRSAPTASPWPCGARTRRPAPPRRCRCTCRACARHSATPGVVETTPAGFRLLVRPGELDADRFAQEVDAGRRALDAGRPEAAGAALRGALGLWRGPPPADLGLEPFAQAEIARLEERRLTALELRVEADLAAGRPLRWSPSCGSWRRSIRRASGSPHS